MSSGRLFSFPLLKLNELRQLWENQAIYEAADEQEDEYSGALLWMVVGAAVAISLRAALVHRGVPI